jgi:quercetin dioxygenase-like cupin family protein
VPLSVDHHHALAEARRLRRAAGWDAEGRRSAAESFRAFFRHDTVRHFREEEELVFPLLAMDGEDAELTLALAQHARIRALVELIGRDPSPARLTELGTLLADHVRLEERVLFERVQELCGDAQLEALGIAPRESSPAAEGSPVVDLAAGSGRGPLWGTASDDLNATLLSWPAGERVAEHVNDERDVLLLCLDGTGRLTLDGSPQRLRAREAVLIPKGARRAVEAGPEGIRYLTVHLRRGGLEIRARA